MNFFKRLFGGSDGPTNNWPILHPTAPALDLRTPAVGPLRFGTPAAEAVVFGRPDFLNGDPASSAQLIYSESGFALDYEEGRLFFVTYFTGPNESEGRHPIAGHSRPTFISASGAQHELHYESTAETLAAALGTPAGTEVLDDEAVVEWEIGELTVEAELDPQGRIKRLNIFLVQP